MKSVVIENGGKSREEREAAVEQIERIIHKLLLLNKKDREDIISDFLEQRRQSAQDDPVLL